MSPRPSRRQAVALGVVLAALALTAGCSSAGPAPGRSSTAGAATPTTAPVASTSPATSPVVASSSTAPVATASPTSSAPGSGSASVSAAPRSTCPSLTIRVILGSPGLGYEFAALQFVNTGTAQCVLNGYPTVTLLRGGATVGRPSTPAGSATSHFVLAPGATAESDVKDFSSCNAPLSDQIRVVAPGSSMTVTRPAQLRVCRLQVSALATPD